VVGFDAAACDVLRQMAADRAAGVRATSLGCAWRGGGVAVVGMATASAVTLFDFAGRRFFEWALLLPLAMPAYVVAYAYTDFCSSAARCRCGCARVWPERAGVSRGAQHGGAVWVFTFSLYPYVYLLARTA
jgi:iron(III) transport system permease protein